MGRSPNTRVDDVLNQMIFWFTRWYHDPLAYVIEFLHETPTHQQAEILKAFKHHHFVMVKSGHGIGKSKLMGWLSNWWLDTRGKKVPLTGANSDQLRVIVLPEIEASNKRKWKWFRDQYVLHTDEFVCLSNPRISKVILRTVQKGNYEALQGFHDCLYLIDEASGVESGVFEVAAGAFGDPGNFGLITGNPTKTSGYMYDQFQDPNSLWYPLTFSSEDSLYEKTYSYTYVNPVGEIETITCHGRQTQKWIDDMERTYGRSSNVFRYRVLGLFANFGADQVIDEKYIRNVYDTPENKKTDEIILGVDPAWHGDDDTGVVIRNGLNIKFGTSWHGFDLVESFNKLKVIYNEYGCTKINIDATGVGAGLYDMFSHAAYRNIVGGYNAQCVMVANAAPEDQDGLCKTLRDWLWWKARIFYRRFHIHYDEKNEQSDKLKSELMIPTYDTKGKYIVVESKDSMRSRGLKSPNLADAHNITFYEDYITFDESHITQNELNKIKRLKRNKLKAPDFMCC